MENECLSCIVEALMINKATVVIPCYNVEAYIQECLDSVMLQGSSVHHTYVVDNNSNDTTAEKVRRWQRINPTFPLTLLFETKPGAPAARNLPLNRVDTKWIQFLDADDLLMPKKIENQINSYPNADVICAGLQRIDAQGKKTTTLPNLNIPLALVQGKAGITSSNLFSTRSIRSVKGWDESLNSSQEYDLMFRIWQTGATFKVDLKTRAMIRERQCGQISQSDPRERWIQILQLRHRMLAEFKHNPSVPKSLRTTLYQSFFDQLRKLAKHDLDAALSFFSEVLSPAKFSPIRSDTTTRAYLVCYRILGFKWAEKLKRTLKS